MPDQLGSTDAIGIQGTFEVNRVANHWQLAIRIQLTIARPRNFDDSFLWLAFAIGPAFDNLDTIEIGAFGVARCVHGERGRRVHCVQRATHRHATRIARFDERIRVPGLRQVGPAEEARRDSRSRGNEGFTIPHRIPDGAARIPGRPDASDRTGARFTAFDPAVNFQLPPSIYRTVERPVTAVIVVFNDVRRGPVVIVGTTAESQFVWILTELLLIGQPLDHRPAYIVAFEFLTTTKAVDACCILEACELVRRPEALRDLGITLDLHHLDQPLEMTAFARIRGIDRFIGIICSLEHVALRTVRVVWNREQPGAPCLLFSHPGPELFFVVAVERCEWKLRHLLVAEKDIAVHVSCIL